MNKPPIKTLTEEEQRQIEECMRALREVRNTYWDSLEWTVIKYILLVILLAFTPFLLCVLNLLFRYFTQLGQENAACMRVVLVIFQRLLHFS